MSICSPYFLHLYDPRLSVPANILGEEEFKDLEDWWAGRELHTSHWIGNCPEGYLGASLGLVGWSGPFAVLLVMLIVVSPFVVGLAFRMRWAAKWLLIAWLGLFLLPFIVLTVLLVLRGFGDADAGLIMRTMLGIPVQIAFNMVVVVLLPAAPILLLDRIVARIFPFARHQDSPAVD